jgi:hypothetical protein
VATLAPAVRCGTEAPSRQVPWGAPTVVAGLAGWGVSFFLTGVVVVPLLAAMEGISLRDLATAQKTDYILVLQTLETVVGFAVIWACVRKYQPLPPDLFRIDGCVTACMRRSCGAHQARARQVQAILARKRLARVGLAGLWRCVCCHRRRSGRCLAV